MSEASDLFEVRMLQLPLVLRERSRQHGADLLREVTLVRAGQPAPAGSPSSRFLALAEELDAVCGPYVAASTQEMDAALDRGEEVLDEIVYRLPSSALGFLEHVRQVLAEVERYCRSDGYLLTLAPPHDIAAYREWSISEVQRQHDGSAPTPWPRWAAEQGLLRPA